jgi:stage II sporulation protein D
VAPAAASGPIRVGLADNARTAELRGVNLDVVELGGCTGCGGRSWLTDTVRAVAVDGGIEIDGRRVAGVRVRGERAVRVNGRDYPGTIELLRTGAAMAVVNEVALEEYLVGVLLAESNERWPQEALRAQAIAARTYAAHHRALNAARPYHLLASTAHQQYAGLVPPASPAWVAVQETRGQVLLWEGDLFPAFYHSESGGYTEDPRLVFAARNLPALRPVVCPFSAGSPHFYWNLDVKLPDLSELLRKHDVGVGTVTAVHVSERTASLRATVVTVTGTRGTVRLRGNDFRRIVGYDVLKSTLFAVAVDGRTARFAGRGYGHGVGMCQWGSKGMAEQGYTARQILEHYYPGTVFGFLSPPGSP